ncbi:MAG TPA: hypothetical protein VJ183_00990 [Chloroflexia bacterium]|nr:hypothetical protein [Chloroflexia bacterium]
MKWQERHQEERNSKRQFGLRVLFSCALALFVLIIAAQGEAINASGSDSVSVMPARYADPDLCSLFPAGKDFRLVPGVGKEGSSNGCQIYDERSGEEHKFYVASVQAYYSVDAAHAQASIYARDPNWKPYSGIGDPGFAFHQPSNPGAGLNSEYNRLTFARNCYVFWGDAGSVMLGGPNIRYNDLSGVLEIASMVDGKLAGLPCAGGGGGGGAGSATPGEPTPETTTPTATPPETPTVTATPETDVNLQVHHIEVVQVVQTEDNKIPLVAGKKTVVRVFVKANALKTERVNDVTASVTIWPEGKSEVEIRSSNGPISIATNSTPRREDTDASINFVVPNDLTAAGFFSVKAVVNPAHSVTENDYGDNDTREPFEFVQRNGLRIGYVRVGYLPPGQTVREWPTGNFAVADSVMKQLYPTADNGIQYYELPWRVRQSRPLSTTDLGEDLNLSLRDLYNRIEGDKPDILFGWLPNSYVSTIKWGGLAEMVLSGDVGHVAWGRDSGGVFSLQVLAHEVGHDLGIRHTATRGDPSSDCDFAADSSTDWPPSYSDSATIHEVGFDVVNNRAIPSSYYDLMSYCFSNLWISPFHYNQLYDRNLRPQGVYVTTRRHRLWVRGWSYFDGDSAQIEIVRPPDSTSGGGGTPILLQGSFHRLTDPFAPLAALVSYHPSSFVLRPSSSVLREGTGNHCLRFMDSTGAILYERCFDLDFRNEESEAQVERQGFVLEVPDPDNVARVALVRNDGGQERELTSLTPSAHAPQITITSPKAGDRWEGEHTITWMGSDEDGDKLRYDIQYSADGKNSWYPLEIASNETQFTFSTDEILPSEQTYIRILASDGFNTTTADVGPLIIPQQANSPSPPPTPQPTLPPATAPTPTVPGTPIVGPGDATPTPGGQPASTSGGAGGALILLIVGGVSLFAVLVLAIALRRPRAPQLPAQGPYPTPSLMGQQPPIPPMPTHAAPPNPAHAAQFRWAEQEYSRLRGELTVRRMAPQQFEAAVRRITVKDAQGRHWMLNAQSGRWLMYDGRAWVWADPYRQG